MIDLNLINLFNLLQRMNICGLSICNSMILKRYGCHFSIRAVNFCSLETFRQQSSILPVTFKENLLKQQFSTSPIVNKKTKIRKQIKNKNLKKDPNFNPWEIRTDSHLNKFLNKKVKRTRDIELWTGIKLEELANQLQLSVDDVMEVILSLKNVNTDYIQSEKSEISDKFIWRQLANQLHFKYKIVENPNLKQEKVVIDKDVYKDDPANEEDMVGRPPVVTIMGHIDHGKTSLLDYLRFANTSVIMPRNVAFQ